MLTATNPLDSLCSVMEKKLTFERGERDMVAMFHVVIGKNRQGQIERHTTRLLDFGSADTDTGDSAMSRTVGYTAAAGAELILFGDIALRGVIIPTHKSIYVPILKRLQDFGISWSDIVEVEETK